MIRRKCIVVKIGLLLSMGLSLMPRFAPASQWKEQAEVEKKMVWYTTIGSADAKMLIDHFRQRYPKVTAEYFRTGGPQLVERIFTEARAGKGAGPSYPSATRARDPVKASQREMATSQ